MPGGAGGALGGEDGRTVGGVGAGVQEALPDDLDGSGGGVDEVVGEESVIAELVKDDLVGREVIGLRMIASTARCRVDLERVLARAPSPRWRMGETVSRKRFPGWASMMPRSSAAQASTPSSSWENSRAGRLRQLATTGAPGRSSARQTHAVPRVRITYVHARQRAASSFNRAFAFARNSSAVGRAKEVWCEKLHTRPAPAPISTQSSCVKGAALSSRATAAAMEAGLYRVPKGLRSTSKPASDRRAPISSAKQLPSTHTVSVRAIVDNFSQPTSVNNFIFDANLVFLRT